MRAAVLDFDERKLGWRDIARPELRRPDEVLIGVEEVGVCGTDRELASFQFGFPPSGNSYLVLGHEALGRVIAAGPEVRSFAPGDLVVPMIRRGCAPACRSCARGRADLCVTGTYRERGIWGMHGYLTEQVVDQETNLVRVPREVAGRAVLIEPLSVVEKAIASAWRVRHDAPERAVIFGAGPIGILAALTLQLRGVEVAVCSLEPVDHPRARLARRAGAHYSAEPPFDADLAIEATGSAEAAFRAIRGLAPLGVLVVLGAQTGFGEVRFLDLITGNRTVLGSVNANEGAFRQAVADLERMDPVVLDGLIERRPYAQALDAITALQSASLKTVLVLN